MCGLVEECVWCGLGEECVWVRGRVCVVWVRGRVCDSSSVGRILADTNLKNPVNALLIAIQGRCFDHCGMSSILLISYFVMAHKLCMHVARYVIVWCC